MSRHPYFRPPSVGVSMRRLGMSGPHDVIRFQKTGKYFGLGKVYLKPIFKYIDYCLAMSKDMENDFSLLMVVQICVATVVVTFLHSSFRSVTHLQSVSPGFVLHICIGTVLHSSFADVTFTVVQLIGQSIIKIDPIPSVNKTMGKN